MSKPDKQSVDCDDAQQADQRGCDLPERPCDSCVLWVSNYKIHYVFNKSNKTDMSPQNSKRHIFLLFREWRTQRNHSNNKHALISKLQR